MAEQLPLKFEFNADRTFAAYYPGSNQEVFNQLQNFASGTGEGYIFLWGEAGHGKSHLLQACCHAASQIGLRPFYLDVAGWVDGDPGLLVGLENFEIVCLDNVDALVGHDNWELALFNFYNQHRQLNHKLLLSARTAPSDLHFKLADLKSRINWGLALKINELDDNDKIAALAFKAKQKGFALTPHAARFLLTHYDRKLSSLWLMLDQLDFASLAAKRKLTIPFLKQIMGQGERTKDARLNGKRCANISGSYRD
jgi:DnaA-homolog protein